MVVRARGQASGLSSTKPSRSEHPNPIPTARYFPWMRSNGLEGVINSKLRVKVKKMHIENSFLEAEVIQAKRVDCGLDCSGEIELVAAIKPGGTTGEVERRK
jgi:hypothetical protein